MDNAAKLQASEDLHDINALKKCAAFERYFMRRLRQKTEDLKNAVLHADLTPAERETKRQVYLEYEVICGMVERDEISANAILARR
ncbi:MAG: hypothetical protein LBK60_06280 [Verrucomicrobiales bacterium]|jgi:hypothetical protein|nr:hypothetical protein [Verrucomicrobiales bacterium]